MAQTQETQPASNWLPEAVSTANDPSYPEAHATISAAAKTVRMAFLPKDDFPLDVTSAVALGRPQ